MKTLVVLLVLLFAGCADQTPQDDQTQESEPENDPSAPVNFADLAMGAGVPAPEWNIGDRFGHHFYFGPQYQKYFGDDGSGIHTDVIVSNMTDSTYMLDTTDDYYSRLDAAYDMPIVGEVDKTNLGASAYDGPFLSYEFPLRDGQEWTADFTLPFTSTQQISLNATWNDRIDTLANGLQSGFEIVGTLDDGTVVLETDYLPKIGWYGKMVIYSPFNSYNDVFYTVNSMGTESDWTGDVYRYDATNTASLVHAAGTDGTSADANLSPPTTMELPLGTTHLFGIQLAAAFTGQAETTMISPSGSQYSFAVQDSGTGAFDLAFFDIEDPEAGTWGAAATGVGVYTYAELDAYAMTEEVVTIGAGGAPSS